MEVFIEPLDVDVIKITCPNLELLNFYLNIFKPIRQDNLTRTIIVNYYPDIFKSIIISNSKYHYVINFLPYLKNLIIELKIRNYSFKTKKAYIRYNLNLLKYHKKIPNEIGETQIKDFIDYMIDKKDIGCSTINIIISAFKFFYGEIMKKKFIYQIRRPQKLKRLPSVLSMKEIKKLLDVIKNIKHKAIILTIYSAGLRISEAVNLKIPDIDSNRKIISIKMAKGNKDRITILSENNLKLLREYYLKYKPQTWLFPGQKKHNHLCVRTVEKIFEIALKKSCINKNATVHSLRHSFATHLLESGVDLRFIQALLGHRSSKTTEIYTHINANKINKIKSPADNFNFEE